MVTSVVSVPFRFAPEFGKGLQAVDLKHHNHDTQVEHQLEGTVWVPEHDLQGHAIVQLMAELPASASCSWHPKVIRR
jgi:hypothetical protein